MQSEIISYKYGVKELRRLDYALAYSCVFMHTGIYVHDDVESTTSSPSVLGYRRSHLLSYQETEERVELPGAVTHAVSSYLAPELEICVRVMAREHVTCPWTARHLISGHLIHLTVIPSTFQAVASRRRPTRLLQETDDDSKTPTRARRDTIRQASVQLQDL